MHKLRNVKLTEEQLIWIWNIDFETYIGWKMYKNFPGMAYIENKELRIQVTWDVVKREYTIWTWEDERTNSTVS
jgi:hypothetical protein